MIETRENPLIKPVRRGLRPLPVHVGFAMAEHAKLQQTGDSAQADLTDMLTGIRLYQDHPFQRGMPAPETVWRAGEVSLLHYPAATKKKTGAPVVMIPSMINRSHILDLMPECSLARWTAGQGHDVYLLDWGQPADDKQLCGMEAVIGQRLIPALRFAAEHAARPVCALGYCMGGTLLAGAAAACLEQLEKLVFLASPWDFHAGDKILSVQVRLGTPSALQMMERGNVLPADWIQSVFAAVNADRAVHKFARFSRMDQDSAQARLFVAVEDWLNDGLDMPCGVADVCIRQWYGDNRPGRGTWRVGGANVDLSRIGRPSLVVAPARDRLVPAESSLAMLEHLPHAESFQPDCGHIGMITGRRAAEQVWRPLAAWVG